MIHAIFSDIHANLEALDAVLQHASENGADAFACLGDLVGYNANPNECVDIIQSRSIPTVAGNHDRVAIGVKEPDNFSYVGRHAMMWTRRHLAESSKQFLKQLALHRMLDERTVLVHAALHPQPNDEFRITSEDRARPTFDLMRDAKLCFFGHTHRACGFHEHNGAITPIAEESFTLDEGRYLLNPGSVGQPRDADLRAAYILYDSAARSIRFIRIDYDRAAAMRKTRAAGLFPKPSLLGRFAKLVRVAT